MSNSSPLTAIPNKLEQQLTFSCSHEQARIPKPHPEAEQLFKHARWLQKRNLLKDDPAQYPDIERLYRIAAAWGHDKANHNLALLLIRGHSDADDVISLPVALAQDLIQRGIPQGYYDMGALLTKGYGVVESEASALQYLRHAADLGNPDAQYYVGDQLFNLSIDYPVPFNIGLQMKKCAAEQGHSEAAFEYAIRMKNSKNYSEALKYFQLAVKAGNETVAFKLGKVFLAPPPSDELDYLAQEKDEERSRRYNILSDILERYSYLNPTVDDIDDIVPLPPAKLPPWDGKTKWLKDWESNVPPPLPSEARIAEMAKAKGLDPATGMPVAKTSPR
ncbi:SEL1-like repeat protein [Vogesella oryzae]|uniref:SEL1-like repeat protein n=1 Tax=Vogesella oryzae TaxID=1735285 RepID=UPI0015823AF5|nr:sel1 repeat family protein [Vogesella oryzae]